MLFPITPTATLRYKNKSLARGDYLDDIEPGSLFRHVNCDTLPAPWLSCRHPEGSVYFIRKGAPSVVSDTDLGVDASRELMSYWTGVACDKAKGLGISLSDSTELYLRMDAGKCNYYFVDHEYQIIFWLDTVAVDDLNFEACASSPSHLPHSVTKLSLGMDKLMEHYIYAKADTLTSNTSVMPHSSDKYEKLLGLLQTAQGLFIYPETTPFRHLIDINPSALGLGTADSSSVKWFIAREWNQYYRTMFFHRLGELGCRLDRGQLILEPCDISETWWFYTISFVSFGIPRRYYNQLCTVWRDNLVDIKDWKPFLEYMLGDWKQSQYTGYALLIFNALVRPSYYKELNSLAVIASFACVISAVLIARKYDGLKNESIHSAVQFLMKSHKASTGHQMQAVILSIPRVMASWGITLAGLNIAMGLLTEALWTDPWSITVIIYGLAFLTCLLYMAVAGMGRICSFRRTSSEDHDMETKAFCV